MKNGYDMTVNAPPVNTYGWLRANQTALPGIRMAHAPVLNAESESVIAWEKPSPVYAGMKTGAGPDMEELLRRSGTMTRVYTLPAGRRSGIVRLHFSFPDTGAEYDPSGKTENTAEGSMGAVCFEAPDGGALTAVMDMNSPARASGLAGMQTKAVVGKNAILRLVQIQRLGRGYTFLNDIGVHCAAHARFELVRLILGGKSTFDGCAVGLSGEGSAFTAEIGYRLVDRERLDMNYESIHTGQNTDCAINAAGVLRGHASKLFRGTIDFRRGCAGSRGNETEDVLLMNETVRNQTIPVILCGEENVVGNHGATIGRLDENLIYYLESRGLARCTIYEMCAQARIDAVVRKIPDERTIQALFPWLAEEAEEPS